MKTILEFLGMKKQSESEVILDQFPMDILQIILDQLDLRSIYVINRVKKSWNVITKIILNKTHNVSPMPQTYLTLRKHPELRPERYYGELYYRSREFENFKLAITDAFSKSNIFKEWAKQKQLTLILWNMQLYFENYTLTQAELNTLRAHLATIINDIFLAFPEFLDNKKLFFAMMGVICEEIRLLTTKKNRIFDYFMGAIKIFLRNFKQLDFIKKLTPKKLHNFIMGNNYITICEELSLLMASIGDFLTNELFDVLIDFLTKNKHKINTLRSISDASDIFKYLIPWYLRYYYPEKEIRSPQVAKKIFNELLDSKNINNSVILSKSLAKISAAKDFTARSRQQNSNLLQLLLKHLVESKEQDQEKREKWFVEVTEALLVFISSNIKIKHDHLQFLFATAKNQSGILHIAKAMKLALENEEKFVTVQEIQVWLETLPAKLPDNYTKLYTLSDLIYLLTKAVHALGLLGALKDKSKIISQLLDYISPRFFNLYDITQPGVGINFLTGLGSFYDEKINSEEIGVYFLNIMAGNSFHNIGSLSPSVISFTCQFIKENLITKDISYQQFVNVILTAYNDVIRFNCLTILLEKHTMLTKDFLNELEKIFKSYQKNAADFLKLSMCYKFFKSEYDLGELKKIFNPDKVEREQFVLIEILQLSRKFCETHQAILNKQTQDALFNSLIEKITTDKFFTGTLDLWDFYRSLSSFPEIDMFNSFLLLFANLNLLIENTSPSAIFRFGANCIELYATRIITAEHLFQLVNIAAKDFDLANTYVMNFALSLSGEERPEKIFQQLANQSAEIGELLPETILQCFEVLQQPEKSENIVTFNEEMADEPQSNFARTI